MYKLCYETLVVGKTKAHWLVSCDFFHQPEKFGHHGIFYPTILFITMTLPREVVKTSAGFSLDQPASRFSEADMLGIAFCNVSPFTSSITTLRQA